MEPSAEPAVAAKPVKTFRIAGFGQRLAALAIDALILGAIGYPLGLLLGEGLAPVGTPARLIGLLVIVPYLGVLGSEIGNGQSFGKKVLRLRIVDGAGRPLPLGRSLARATLLSLPWIFNGMRFGSLGRAAPAALWLAGVLVFGIGGAIVGTYAFNRRTRQALHDLLVGSYVVNAADVGRRAPAESTRRPLVASIAWIALVAAATMALGLGAHHLLARAFPPVLLESVMAIPGASSAEIGQIPVSGAGGSRSALVAVLWYRGPQQDMKKVADEVAAAILRHHPGVAEVPTLAIKVIRGWDVGVAWKTMAQEFAKPPAEWQAQLGH